MGLSMAQHLDFAVSTLANFNKAGKFEMVQDKENYEYIQILTEKKIRFSGGTSIKRTVNLDPQGNARYKPLFFATDQTAVRQGLKQIDVPWAAGDASWGWDINEVALQSEPEEYVDLMLDRREAAMLDMSEVIEGAFWNGQASAADTEKPFGIDYWLPLRDNASTGEGFDAQTIRYTGGTTATIAGGIDAAVETNWRPWAATYTAVDNLLLKRLRKAFIKAIFIRPPAFHKPTGDGPAVGPTAKLYCGSDEYIALQELMDLRDDNTRPQEVMGGVLARSSNILTVNQFEVMSIPFLDTASFAPFRFIDWSKLKPFVHRTRWMVETGPKEDKDSHTGLIVHRDFLHNTLVENRRRCGFTIHTVTS